MAFCGMTLCARRCNVEKERSQERGCAACPRRGFLVVAGGRQQEASMLSRRALPSLRAGAAGATAATAEAAAAANTSVRRVH